VGGTCSAVVSWASIRIWCESCSCKVCRACRNMSARLPSSRGVILIWPVTRAWRLVSASASR
jgi:hypothetical protein